MKLPCIWDRVRYIEVTALLLKLSVDRSMQGDSPLYTYAIDHTFYGFTGVLTLPSP